MKLLRRNSQEIPWRFEYKYRLPRQQYYRFKNALVAVMEPDPYTRAAPPGGYLVRSLYYDTDDFASFYEKIEGNSSRIKCRLRTYGEHLEEGTPLRAELKTRRGEAIEKYSAFISPASYSAFIDSRHWPEHNEPVLTEFERLVFLRAMRPKVLVQYRREGFLPRDRDDLRITLDHSVCSCLAENLFPGNPFFRQHHRHLVILEIKCRHRRPPWLNNMVRSYGLKYVANSKYTQGIRAVRPDLAGPY